MAQEAGEQARMKRLERLSRRLELALYDGVLPDALEGLDGTAQDSALASRLWTTAQRAWVLILGDTPPRESLESGLMALAELRGLIDLGWLARLHAALLMKSGPSGYSDAYLILSREERLRPDGAVFLGLGHYLSRKPMPEPALARRYYLKAALRGRAAGFRRCFELSVQQEEGWASLFSLLGASAVLLSAPFRRLESRQIL